MKNQIILLLSLLLVFAITCTGCATKGEKTDLNIQKITYLVVNGDSIGTEIIVISSDLNAKKYQIMNEIDGGIDLKKGQLPPEGTYILKEYTIPEESWNALIDSVNENDFASLPEDLSNSKEVSDAADSYIIVTTDQTSYTVGGRDAGGAKDKASKRFAKVKEQFIDSFYEGSEVEF